MNYFNSNNKYFLLIFFLIFINTYNYGQEYTNNSFEKGYLSDGYKIGIWEYFDVQGNLELKVDYGTGNVFYLKENNSEFVIESEGNWIKKHLTVYPKFIGSEVLFYEIFQKNINYPSEAFRNKIQGKIYLYFEIDTLGRAGNVNIYNNIGGGCGAEILRVFSLLPNNWIPAIYEGKKVKSRFILPVQFNLGQKNTLPDPPDLPNGKVLEEIFITAIGVERTKYAPFTGSSPQPEKSHNSLKSALKDKEKATKLYLVSQGIKSLSPEIGQLPNLKFLSLEYNMLTTLPSEIKELVHLEELYLLKNQIKKLNPQFKSLENLHTLGLSENRFKEFPLELVNLPNLKVLDLSFNKISEIPGEINNLKNLEVLSLHNNKIRNFPEEFYQLNLKKLYLDNNPISSEELSALIANFKQTEIYYNGKLVNKTELNYVLVEKQPEFPGGLNNFFKFISNHLDYPAEARKNRYQGKVYVQFIIEPSGEINQESIEVVKGVHQLLDQEAIRVIKLCPAWEPGTQKNTPVRVKMVVPITFKVF